MFQSPQLNRMTHRFPYINPKSRLSSEENNDARMVNKVEAMAIPGKQKTQLQVTLKSDSSKLSKINE